MTMSVDPIWWISECAGIGETLVSYQGQQHTRYREYCIKSLTTVTRLEPES